MITNSQHPLILKITNIKKLIATSLIGMSLLTALPGCVSHQARMEELRLQIQQNDKDRAEARKWRQEAYAQQQQEQNTIWMNSLTPEQRARILQEKEKTQQATTEAEGQMVNGIFRGLGNAFRRKYYFIGE
jgi:hypothetical protein